MADKLDMDWINSKGQIYAIEGKNNQYVWPLVQICVETGCSKIDVCGLTQNVHISDYCKFKNDDGEFFELEDFYLDGERALKARPL